MEGVNKTLPELFVDLCLKEDVTIIPQVLNQSKPENEIDGSEDYLPDAPRIHVTYIRPESEQDPIIMEWREFYVEPALITVLQSCLSTFNTVTSLKLIDCLHSEQVMELLSAMMSAESARNVLSLWLDRNTRIQKYLSRLLSSLRSVAYLSLRSCTIDNKGCRYIKNVLSSHTYKLQALNLTNNRITDAGVTEIATAMRTNRRLVSLDLAGNQITDEGVKCLVDVLVKFPLTIDELRTRSKMKFDICTCERDKLVSSQVDDGNAGGVTRRKGRKPRPNETAQSASMSNVRKQKKIESKSSDREIKSVKEPQIQPEVEEQHPFLYEVHSDGNQLVCPGSFKLANLNLSYNKLSEKSAAAFQRVFTYQNKFLKSPDKGLVRLVILPGNNIDEQSLEYCNLTTAISNKRNAKLLNDEKETPNEEEKQNESDKDKKVRKLSRQSKTSEKQVRK